MVTADFEGVLAGRRRVGDDDWEVVFESRPCMQLSYRNDSPFQSPNSGGRLLLDGDRLLLSLGDHHLDGMSNPEMASQRDDSDYGKVIAIDLVTLSSSHLAKGVRNPQGLAMDRYGRLWLTEHGPRGGDELNIVRAGENYGWPLVTLGTAYGAFDWNPNPEQGRHQGYAAPVYSWVPSIGPSNLLEVRGMPARWDGDLLVASLEANTLFRLRIEDERVVLSEPIRIGERIRDLVQMPDGTVLLWTDSRRLIELTSTREGER
jgi:glucose/arabinose dehydrogenase